MANFTPVGVELVVKGADKFNSTLGKATSSIAGFGKAAVKVAAVGVAAFGAAVVGVGAASIKAAVSFESAFAGVIKTTDGLADSITGELTPAGKEMQQQFRDLAKEVPVAVEELLAIGEVGGQLGIASENLIDFTETIAAMGEATNLTTEEAAVGFAQLANVMGTSQDEISNMGSAIVALGNNFATNERDILNFASRLAGAGEVAGLTEADVLGISAAFSSVGIQAQAGGTATSKALIQMNTAAIEGGEMMEIFAAVAGIEAENFGAAWEDDAGAVFGEFVKGLGLAGDDAIGILDALEIKDSQAIRAFLSLAGAGDLITDTLETSGQAFADNTALAAEAEARYRTTESQFKIFQNTIKDIAITIGSALLPILNELLDLAKPLIAEFAKRLPKFMETKLIPAIRKVTAWVGKNLPKAIEFLSGLWKDVLQPAIETVSNFIAGTVIPIVQRIIGLFQSEGPSALSNTSNFITGTLIPAFQNIASFVTGTLIPVIGEIVELFTNQFNKVVKWTEDNWPLIQETISDTLGTISHIVETVVGAITDFWTEHGKQIMSAVSDAWDAIKWAIDSAINLVLGIIQAVLKVISGDWRGAWEDVKTAVESAWGDIVGWLQGTAIPWLVETVGNVGGFLVEKGGEAIAALWQGLKDNVPKIIEWLTGTALPWIVRTVGNLAVSLFKAAKEILGQFLEGLKQAIPEVIRWIIDVAGPFVVRNILDWGAKLLEAGKALIGDIWEGLKDAIPQIYAWIKDTAGPALVRAVIDIGEALYRAGKAIIERLRAGLAEKLEEVRQWFADQMRKITDLLPFSEPKDTSSPLRGLSKAGENIVLNILDGMQRAFPKLFEALDLALDRLFQLASGFSSFGRFIARMLEKETIDPIRDQLDALDDELAKLSMDFKLPGAARGRELELFELFKIDPKEAKRILRKELGLDPTEMRGALAVFDAMLRNEAERKRLSEERIQLEEELIRQQKKLLELQEKQSQLQFLQEQFKLLELIKEFGLSPEDILGGLELGLGASLDDLLAAMTRALEELIKRINDELGISSPSKVFMAMGKNLMAGFTAGIESMGSSVEKSLVSNLIPTDSMAAPATMSGVGSIANSTEINFNLSPTINTDMDIHTFEQRVVRIVTENIG